MDGDKLIDNEAKGSQRNKTIMRKVIYISVMLLASMLSIPCVAGAQIITTIAGRGFDGYDGDGGPATAAALSWPDGVITIATGNVYYADVYHHVIRKINATGIISTIAGDGTLGYSGDGGPASAARLHDPDCLALDILGNIYVMDAGNFVVRKITTSGIISTVAGNGTIGYSGDGGPATNAQLSRNSGLATDAVGNIYISDYYNQRIRKINSGGVINTVAGTGTPGFSGDGGPATAAQIHSPGELCLDTAGNIYFSDESNHRVRKINTSGVITTFAGNGGTGFYGDGGPALSCTFSELTGIQADHLGNIFVADHLENRVRKINSTGIITTYAGGGTTGLGDGGPAIAAQLSGPGRIWVDRVGNLFIGDNLNHRIRKVNDCVTPAPIVGSSVNCVSHLVNLTDGTPGGAWSSGNTAVATVSGAGIITGVAAGTVIISYTTISGCGAMSATKIINIINTPVINTIAGTGTVGYNGDTGPATSAELNYPTCANIDASGNLYIADNINNVIRKVSTSGVISTFAGTGAAGYSGNGGPATAATFNRTNSLTFDHTGNMYVVDQNTSVIRKINSSGIITTVAGGGFSGLGDGGPATVAQLDWPAAVAFDATGNMYITEVHHKRIRKVNTSGIISTIAGNGTLGYTGDGGPATAAVIGNVNGIAIDATDNIYFTDFDNNVIRKINTAGIVKTIAGTGVAGFTGDGGPATAAKLNTPYGLAFDATGNLFFSESNGNHFRKINSSGIISTVAGNGSPGFSGDGGDPMVAELNKPTFFYVNTTGSAIYFADEDNQRVRKISIAKCDNTAIGNIQTQQFELLKLYPNPNHGSFTINLQSANEEPVSVLIMNMTGQKVMDFEITTNRNVPVAMSTEKNITPGIYFISALLDGRRYFSKFLVE